MVERLTLEQLVDRSERIVHGRCMRTWSAWDADRHAIWTHCEIAVADPLKGSPARTIVVSEPGGVVGGMEMMIDGVPRLRANEEVVLFLYRTPIGYWRARGLGQGKYDVSRDQRSGQTLVRADTQGLAVIEPREQPPPRSTDLRRLDGVPLEQFKATIRSFMVPSRDGRAN